MGAFQALLTAIYTDKVEVTDSNLEFLTMVGKKYQIVKIQLACTTYMKKSMNIKNVCQMFESGQRLLGDDKFGLPFIRENFELIKEEDSFLKLSKPRLKTIISDDKLAAEEFIVLQALIKWGKAECERQKLPNNQDSLKTTISDLLDCIRFPHIELEHITKVVTPSNLVSTDKLLLLYQYASIKISDEMKDKKKEEETKGLSEMEKARIATEIKEKEECIEKVKKIWSIKQRSGAFVVKDSKLINKKQKKQFYGFFNIRPGGKLVLKLLYRGSRDGFNAQAFHSKCDDKGATLVVIKSKGYPNIFGGYCPVSWTGNSSYVSNDACWLFSLINSHKKPVKLVPSQTSNHLYMNTGYGPTFGGGHDIYVCSTMQSTSNYCNPNTYRQFAPGYDQLGITYTNTLLAGSYNFFVEEIEIFQIAKITNVKKD